MQKKGVVEVVTFVFCDIEHSTQLVQQLREAYAELLEKYRQTIRDSIDMFNGKEIDTSGDGFFMIFYTPEDAVLAAAQIQTLLYHESWAKSNSLKVRIGIHTGKALLTDLGYSGVEVHAASRICDAAHGGQVIVSGATMKLLNIKKLPKYSLSDLGQYTLKYIKYPTKLFQLNIPGTSLDFPKPRIKPEEKRIAVLPFTTRLNVNNYIGEGIAEELIIALGKVEGLRVVSRSTSFSLKNQELEATEVGKKLNVDSVLEGRVRIVNDDIILSVELIDAGTGLNIWAEHYQEKRDGLVKIQDDIIRQIAEILECPLNPEQLGSVRYRQSHNAEAYDYYLRGRRFYLQFSTRGAELATKMFEKAIEADDSYALAFAGLSDCHSYLYQHKDKSKINLEKADKASKEAVDLSPDLAKAHVSRGIVLSLLGESEASELSFETAIELNPTLFLGWYHYGRACFANGNLEKAARLFQQANRVEPDDFQSILLSAQIYDDFGSRDFAQILRKRGVDIAKKSLDLNPGDTRAMYYAANALAHLNDKDESLKLIHMAITLDPDDSMLLYNAGCVYALLEMKNESLSCLERAYKAGLTLKGWYENDSNLENVRNEERFQNLLVKLK